MTSDRYSATAYLIAKSTVFLSKDPELGHLVPHRSAEISALFVKECSRHSRVLLDLMDVRWFRFLIRLIEICTVPGLITHFAVRKLCIENLVRASIKNGVRRVVVLAAGFDTLAPRLHGEFPEVQFIELDRPETQAIKRNALERARASGTNLYFHSVDFSEGCQSSLATSIGSSSKDVATVFVAEGLTMYLTQTEIDSLFDSIREAGSPRNSLVFTFMEKRPDGRIAFRSSRRFVNWWLGWHGEVFKWGLGRQDMGDFLATRGFALKEVGPPEAFREERPRFASSGRIRVALGEMVCVADVAEHAASTEEAVPIRQRARAS